MGSEPLEAAIAGDTVTAAAGSTFTVSTVLPITLAARASIGASEKAKTKIPATTYFSDELATETKRRRSRICEIDDLLVTKIIHRTGAIRTPLLRAH